MPGPRLRRLASLVAAALLLAAPAPAAAQEGRLLGLVVGASDYGRGGLPLGPLNGPRNDALLIAELLLERGAEAADLTVLTEAEGRPDGHVPARPIAISGPPTAQAILAAFDALERRVRPGDQVVILLAGHGWRQREAVPGSEPDGLDEVFLPVDYGPLPAGFEPARHDPVPGALRDDEIGARIDALRRRGADVFLIADFCHAGDSTRGPLDPVRPAVRESRLDPPAPAGGGRGAYAAFFAAPAGDRAMQGLAPIWAEPGLRRPHGLLTAYVAAALRDPAVTTYAEAAARVQASLLEHDVRDGAVRLEGPAVFEGDLDRPLPGAQPGGAVWTVRKPASAPVDGRVALAALAVDAGALHGLEPGALVAVAEVRQGRERVLLYGRATRVEATRAVLEPAGHAGLGPEAWADVRAADGRPYTDRRLWLARPVAAAPPPPVAVARPADRAVAAALAGLGAAEGVAWREPEAAELHLRREGEWLVVAASADPAAAAAELGRAPLDQPEAARAAVARAARAARLRRLLQRLERDGRSPPGLAAGFHLWRPPGGARPGPDGRPACPPFDPRHAGLVDRPPADAAPLSALGVTDGEPVTLRPCDVLWIQAANTGPGLLDVAAVALGPDGAVWPLPWAGDRAAVRFEPGRARVAAYQLDPAPSGDLWEELALVAAPVDGRGGAPLSLARLAQPGVGAPPGPDDRLRSGATDGAALGPAVGVRRLLIRVAD